MSLCDCVYPKVTSRSGAARCATCHKPVRWAKGGWPEKEEGVTVRSLQRFAPSAEPEIDAATGRATFIFNTEEVGRDGHIVRNAGIQKSNFERNPVILFAHDDRQPPIGRATALRIGDPASKVEIEFTPRDLYPFGATIGEMVKARYLNACSESWQPIKWHFMTDRSGVIFDEVDLLEISIVPIPALPDAVATARANGIDTQPLYEWAEQLLDTGGMLIVPRDELETLRRAARMPAASKPTQDSASVASTLTVKHKRALARAPKVPVFKRGLYSVAQLCELLSTLGYCHDSAEYEADLEGDSSPVPGMLGDALVTLGEALKAMAAEEVDELLEAHDYDDEDAELETRALSASELAYIAEGTTARARAWRAGIAVSRAGKALSSANQDKLEDAQGHHDRAMKHSRALGEHHDAVSGHLKEAGAAHERATSTLEEFGEHVRAAQDEPEKAPEHLKRAMKSHGEAEKHMGAIGEAHADIADRHADTGDSHQGMERCVKSAQRCVRGVLAGAVTSEADEPAAKAMESGEAAKEEKARKAREARLARARELAKQHRERITLD